MLGSVARSMMRLSGKGSFFSDTHTGMRPDHKI